MTDVDKFLKHHGITNLLTHSATGNTTAVIVALPAPLDGIRLIGDEEKHATMLFFGETATLSSDSKSTILSTLEQASKFVPGFSERLIDISRLGSDTPPALVAMLSNTTIGKVRNLLRVNPKIEDYMGNTTQFPSFTPHVTLAHPDFRVEEELRKLVAPLVRVQFDRLALWWNDERFEFNLNDVSVLEGSSDQIAMAETLDTFLAHYGVPGMRWGHRKSSDSDSAGVAGGASKPDAGDDVHLSADAERFIKTHQKQGVEMSDREIKEAVQRANIVKQYNDLFAPDANKQLADQVAALKLQKDFNQLNAELHPSAITRVSNFVTKFGGTSFKAFQALDKLTSDENGKGGIADQFIEAFGGGSSGKPNAPKVSTAATPKPKKPTKFRVEPSKVKITNPNFTPGKGMATS